MKLADPVILPESQERIETFQTSEGKFFRSFLIGTKRNSRGWAIHRNTGHDKVKTFIGKDFAIIPELIQKPVNEGGGGHMTGSRNQILKAYEDNSHGKIAQLVGPFYYPDSAEDYWYDQITKLSNSRSASVLHTEGQKTWNGYDVSPHVFVNKGEDEIWEDWEGAALNLVIRGAYGPQAIITKFCDGTESKCFKDLIASSSNSNDETIVELITSHLSKIASTPHSMANDTSATKPDTGIPDSGITANKDKSTPTTDTQKHLTNAPKVENESVQISAEELKALKERAESFTEMENERKTEKLQKIFSIIKDDEEQTKILKEYSKLDMKTVKLIESFYEKIQPRIEDKVRAELKAEAKEAEKKDESKDGEKKADDKKKEERSASSLDKEPKKPKFTSPDYNDNDGEERSASVPEIRNQAYLLRQKMMQGRNRE